MNTKNNVSERPRLAHADTQKHKQKQIGEFDSSGREDKKERLPIQDMQNAAASKKQKHSQLPRTYARHALNSHANDMPTIVCDDLSDGIDDQFDQDSIDKYHDWCGRQKKREGQREGQREEPLEQQGKKKTIEEIEQSCSQSDQKSTKPILPPGRNTETEWPRGRSGALIRPPIRRRYEKNSGAGSRMMDTKNDASERPRLAHADTQNHKQKQSGEFEPQKFRTHKIKSTQPKRRREDKKERLPIQDMQNAAASKKQKHSQLPRTCARRVLNSHANGMPTIVCDDLSDGIDGHFEHSDSTDNYTSEMRRNEKKTMERVEQSCSQSDQKSINPVLSPGSNTGRNTEGDWSLGRSGVLVRVPLGAKNLRMPTGTIVAQVEELYEVCPNQKAFVWEFVQLKDLEKSELLTRLEIMFSRQRACACDPDYIEKVQKDGYDAVCRRRIIELYSEVRAHQASSIHFVCLSLGISFFLFFRLTFLCFLAQLYLAAETIALAVNLLDRYLALKSQPFLEVKKIAVAAVVIASKMHCGTSLSAKKLVAPSGECGHQVQ
jgi:hypothetical protein